MFKLSISNIFKVFTILFLFLNNILLADNSSIYKVDNVVIDITDVNSELARSKAIEDAQNKAFYKLLDWMTLAKDKYLFEKKELFNPQDFTLSYSVSDEKVTETRYRARFTVQFEPETIRNLLKNLGIKFTEIKGEPLLVLPVLKWGSVLTLWDDPNPWFDIWLERPLGVCLVPLILPYADVTDLTTLTAVDAISLDRLRLRELRRRYNAKNILVAIAQITESPEGRSALLIEIKKLEGEKIKIFEPIILNDKESLNLVFKKGLDKVTNHIDDSWTNEHISNVDFLKDSLTLNVYFTSFEDWRNIRSILDKLKLIREYRITELSVNDAQINIDFHGDFELARQGLMKEGLILEWSDGWSALLLKQSKILKNNKDLDTIDLKEKINPIDEQNTINQQEINELLVE